VLWLKNPVATCKSASSKAGTARHQPFPLGRAAILVLRHLPDRRIFCRISLCSAFSARRGEFAGLRRAVSLVRRSNVGASTLVSALLRPDFDHDSPQRVVVSNAMVISKRSNPGSSTSCSCTTQYRLVKFRSSQVHINLQGTDLFQPFLV